MKRDRIEKTGRGVSGVKFFCISFVVLFLSTGCSYHDGQYSYFNMVSPAKRTLENKKAAQNFWASVRPVSTLPASNYKLGQFYLHQQKFTKAIDEFTKAIRSDSSFCKAYNGLGISYDALKDCVKAEEAYEKAVQCGPEEAYLYNNYAYSSMLCGNHAKGLALLRKAEKLSGGNVRIDQNIKLAQTMLEYEAGAVYQVPSSADNHLSGRPELLQDRAEKTVAVPSREKLSVKANSGDNLAIVKISQERTKIITVKDGMDIPPRSLNSVIQLLNGNGKNGMAARSASYLNGNGFQIRKLGNAAHFDFNESVIYYRPGFLQIAKDIAGVIPGSQQIQRIDFLGKSTVGVRVVLGRDLVNMRFPEGFEEQSLSSGSELKKTPVKPSFAATDREDAAVKQFTPLFI